VKRVSRGFIKIGVRFYLARTCKVGFNRGKYKCVAFDFLGYTFRLRWIKTRKGGQGLYFLAVIGQKSAKGIRHEINSWPWKCWCQKELKDINSYRSNRLRGWMNYYSLFGASIIRNVLFHFDKRLSRWGKAKYKKLKTLMQAARRVNPIRKEILVGFPIGVLLR